MTVEPAPELSDRELEILRLVATGASNAQIARELFISPNTVKVHLRNIFAKLGVDSRTGATMVAVQRGWVTVPGTGEAAGAPPVPASAAPTVPRHTLPRAQRAYLLAAAVLSAAFLYLIWPRVQAQECSPSIDSERCGSGAPATDSRWRARALMPTARGRLALVTLPAGLGADQPRLLAIGGETDDGVTGVVEAFTPATNAWASAAPKPTAVSNIGAVLLGGRVYVPGGTTAERGVTDVLEIYDPAADAWSAGALLPAPRAGYALATIRDRLYLFGGTDGQGYPAATLVYDPAAEQWTSGAPLPTPRAFAGAGVLQGRIYVVGGYDLDHEFDACERYDPATDRWEPCAPLGLARGGVGVAVVLDRLYAVGGGWTRVLAFSERYDPLADAWARFDTPIRGEWRTMGAAALEGDLYTVGGWDGSGYVAAVEQYQAVFKTYLPATQR